MLIPTPQLAGVQHQLRVSQVDLATTEQARVDLAAQRDELASQEEHWTAIQATSERVDCLVKLFEDKSRSETDDLEKFRYRANFLEGELSALQKTSNEQEKKITVLNKASAASKATILNAQQRASEWEKKANERQQELDESRQQLKEIAQSHDASVKNVEKLTTQITQMEESERITSVCCNTICRHTLLIHRHPGTRDPAQRTYSFVGFSASSRESRP